MLDRLCAFKISGIQPPSDSPMLNIHAPALKRSDIGVAMGQRGSDVSREVADVVLLDDNSAAIVAAIEEGRSIYATMQKFIRFFFSTELALFVLLILLSWIRLVSV